MNLLKQVSPASSCFPGYPLETAVNLIYATPPKELFIHKWNYSHIQLCPQHIGFISEKSAEELKNKYPNTKFRLHANVRLFTKLRPFDAGSIIDENQEYILNLKKISKILGSDTYSYHAPMSDNLNWNKIRENILYLQDFLNIPVAIEGLYPTKKPSYWDNSFAVYETFLNSDINFAIDLSHLNIAYEKMSNEQKEDFSELAIKMINSPNCLEIHISGNDGLHDEHKPISGNEWWFNVLNNLENNQPIIFCESKQN
jgi:hypothetical protein